MDTRQKILEKALEMFNERGIEYVGLRELAGLLQMRVGNITYYFPTKDDLVYAVSQELTKLNSQTLVEVENLSLMDWLNNLRQAFDNHQKFQCLMLSIVHITRQNVHLQAEYKKTQIKRNATLLSNVDELVKAGYLVAIEKTDKDVLVSGISLVSRFWISQAVVSHLDTSIGDQRNHFLKLITTLVLPYTTPKGKKEVDAFLASLH